MTDKLLALGHMGTVVTGVESKRPKASLLERLGCRSAKPMYIDKKDGTVSQVGYEVSFGPGTVPEWFTLYRVECWEVSRMTKGNCAACINGFPIEDAACCACGRTRALGNNTKGKDQ